MDINIVNEVSHIDDAYMYQAIPKQHLKLDSWVVKQQWQWVEKKGCLYKKRATFDLIK